MPRKSQKTEEKSTSRVSEQESVVEATTQPKARASKKQPVKQPVKQQVVETQVETEQETQVETQVETEQETQTSRQVPTRDSVTTEFDELISAVDAEIESLRTAPSKSKGIKFLRTVNKRLKTLKSHALRVSKQRPSSRRKNTNSGFLKPVNISKELAKFTGWDQNEPRSRVDVTKYICNYIKEHNLQDPEDRRNIRVENDANLKKLLRFDGKDKKPLTYYSLQTYLKSHFVPSAQTQQ